MSYPTAPYRIVVRKFAGDFDYSPGDVIAEIPNFYELGWADYVNDVPEAFFTILQREEDETNAPANLLRQYEGRAHVFIYRQNDLVWRGWLMEYDGTAREAVFYCYGYLGGLYWQATDWDEEYVNSTIGAIVTAEWARTRDFQLSWTGSGGPQYVSMLHWLTTGTIESPVTISGGATPITLPNYRLHRKRILFMLRELAAIAISDTTNTVHFEITQEETPLFNFWKDHGVNRPGLVFEYGDDQVADFRHLRAAVNTRNRLYGVGSNPADDTLRYTITGHSSLATQGLREEALYLAWVRDQAELERVTRNRLARARRVDNDIAIVGYPNSLVPPYYLNRNWNLTDRVRLIIDHGVSEVDGYFTTTGVRVKVSRTGVERVQVLLQETVGIDSGDDV